MFVGRDTSRVWPLSIANGVATGAIAVFFYVYFGTARHELWDGVAFRVFNYLAVVAVCIANTRVFFAWLASCPPTPVWKGVLLGTVISSVGSFLCSAAAGLGTGHGLDLVYVTVFFLPVSALVGAVAGGLMIVLSRPG